VTIHSAPTKTAAPKVAPLSAPLSNGRVAWLLMLTIFLAVAAYYFVGVDEGMMSVFGKSMVIHEWVHDSRHFLGFPCH
jgi:Probable cobalt transporter subunit (CbtB)